MIGREVFRNIFDNGRQMKKDREYSGDITKLINDECVFFPTSKLVQLNCSSLLLRESIWLRSIMSEKCLAGLAIVIVHRKLDIISMVIDLFGMK